MKMQKQLSRLKLEHISEHEKRNSWWLIFRNNFTRPQNGPDTKEEGVWDNDVVQASSFESFERLYNETSANTLGPNLLGKTKSNWTRIQFDCPLLNATQAQPHFLQFTVHVIPTDGSETFITC